MTAPPRFDVPDEVALALGARRCAPMGRLDYVVRTVRSDAPERTWYVVTPDPSAWRGYAAFGIEIDAGSRVVFDGETLRPLAVLAADDGLPEDPPPPCGHNPYFDTLPPHAGEPRPR